MIIVFHDDFFAVGNIGTNVPEELASSSLCSLLKMEAAASFETLVYTY
jgi:hypothetical protein